MNKVDLLPPKLNEALFLANSYFFVSQLKNQNTLGETLFEIPAAAKTFATKNSKCNARDKAVEKTRKYLKDHGLLAVPFEKGLVFA